MLFAICERVSGQEFIPFPQGAVAIQCPPIQPLGLQPYPPTSFPPAVPGFDPYTLQPDYSLIDRIVFDHREFYSCESLTLLAGGLGVGGVMANTSIDTHLRSQFHASFERPFGGTLHQAKELGNGRYTLPLFAATWVAGNVFPDSPHLVVAGEWGERSMRSFLVGAPPMLLTQRLTGGSRPGETDHASSWQPFQDNNGVSGHSFMSAIPFINAAKMTDRPLLKGTFYAGSFLGPLSRISDDAHYTSQAALGWWFAYLSATAIDRVNRPGSRLQVQPWISENGAPGAMFKFQY